MRQRDLWTCTSSTAGLRRSSLGGVVGDSAAILEDHAAWRPGLLALHQATGGAVVAGPGAPTLLDTALDHFADPDAAGRWYRHRRRRRAAGAAASRSDRRRHPVGCVARSPKRCSWQHIWRPTHCAALRDRGRRDAGRRDIAAGAGAALGRALARGGRGGGARSDPDRRRVRAARLRAAGRRAQTGARRGRRGRRRGEFVGVAAWTGRGSAGPMRRMCAGGGCATCPSPAVADLAAALGRSV